MQQRYYDPAIGRFLSVDPMASDMNIGWNYNRYNYAANNPYRNKDPDGRACDSLDGGGCGAPRTAAPIEHGATDQLVGGIALGAALAVASRNPVVAAARILARLFSKEKPEKPREAPNASKESTEASRALPGSDKQFGKKYGEHHDSSREGYRSPQEYRERANEMYNSRNAERTNVGRDAPEHAGETHIRENGDLLRLDSNGTFRSMYPDP